MNARTFVVVALALLGTACVSGRSFKTPRSLTEERPVRHLRIPPGEMPDEPFRSEPPARIATKPRPLTLPTEARLSNGVRVIMLERHDFPSISAVLVLDRGAVAAGPGVAALYGRAFLGASSAYPRDEAWRYLAFVGASVTGQVSFDAVTMQITALTPLFNSALSRAAPMFVSPALETADLDDARTHLAADRAHAADDPAVVASQALFASVFPPPHPYGVPISGGSLATTATNGGLRVFRDESLSAEHVGVACAGDFKPAWLLATLEKTLGSLPKHSLGTAPALPPPVRAGRRVIVIDRPGATQSAVAIGWPGLLADDREHAPLDVLASATAGELASRLNLTVRRELGASYGVRMSATSLRSAGVVQISAAVDTAKTREAVRGMLVEVEKLRAEPLSDAELASAKSRTMLDFDGGSSRGVARALARSISEGRAPAHVVTYNARVDLVTAEDVRATADRVLARDDTRIIVVGDASKIAAGLRTLDAGDVVVR